MKLRNRKTSEIGVLEATTYHGGRPDNIVEVCEVGMGAVRVLAQYNTLSELLEEWEDYEPTEARIEDERARKVVRAWAELNAVKQVVYVENLERDYCCLANKDDGRCLIKFVGCISPLKDCGEYFIDELCGEGEE